MFAIVIVKIFGKWDKFYGCCGGFRAKSGGGAIAEKCPISIVDVNKWEWAQGVGMYGFYRAYEETRDEALLAFLRKWYKDRFAEGFPPKSVNTCARSAPLSFAHCFSKKQPFIHNKKKKRGRSLVFSLKQYCKSKREMRIFASPVF